MTLLGLGAYSASVEDITVGIIVHEFGMLNLDRAGVRRFVADYYALVGPNRVFLGEWRTKAYYLLRVGADRSQLVKSITTQYLLSTDFFLNRMDERRQVKYLGWYNPYRDPCLNPFSTAIYPPGVS